MKARPAATIFRPLRFLDLALERERKKEGRIVTSLKLNGLPQGAGTHRCGGRCHQLPHTREMIVLELGSEVRVDVH